MDFGARNQRGNGRSEDRGNRRRIVGWVTPALVALLCLGLLLASYNHVRGNFHRLRTAVIKPPPVAAPVSAGPGGQHAVQLVRSATTLGSEPEFLSVTLLPGRGMEVLQITATLPAKGEVQLLHAPPLDAATQLLTGTGDDANGQLSTTFGGAFLAPWAGRLTGSPAESSPGHLAVNWHGHHMMVPAAQTAAHGASLSVEGLLSNLPSSTVDTGVLADGQWAQAIFHAGNFGDAWPSSLDLSSRVEMSAHNIDLILTGKNVGTVPLPLGLGWKPFFAIPSGDRASARLQIPAGSIFSRDKRTGLPTGHQEPIANSDLYLGRPGGTPLGTADIDESYTNLQSPVVADGPAVELLDPGSDYGLRLTLLSSSLTTLHVRSLHSQPWVSMEADTNAPDPFGREWPEGDSSGLRVLQPGESLTLRVRLELFAISASGDATRVP